MKKDTEFTARDVLENLGIDKNKLFYWMHTHGLLTPLQEADGPGSRVVFSIGNLLTVARIKMLIEMGYSLKGVKKLLGEIEGEKNGQTRV